VEENIIIQDVSKYYGKNQALNHVTLTIEKGMFGLLGRNGAGKTTLMKAITTILTPSSGSICVCGYSVKEAKKVREQIGYLPQDFSMYANMSAYSALDYLGVLSGLNKQTRASRIPILLEKVNLHENSEMKVRTMSGGMRRRLGIAQAILNDPKVIIVDEPTAGLDPEERVRFRNLLSEIAEDKIVILSTHIVGDIEATCEKIAVLNKGEIIYNGTVETLLDEADGHIYEAKVSKIEVNEIKNKYRVTNILMLQSEAQIRFCAEEGMRIPDCAYPATPNVEDAYIYLMQKNGGEVQ